MTEQEDRNLNPIINEDMPEDNKCLFCGDFIPDYNTICNHAKCQLINVRVEDTEIVYAESGWGIDIDAELSYEELEIINQNRNLVNKFIK